MCKSESKDACSGTLPNPLTTPPSFCSGIERFLTLRRHESFTLHSVLVGFRTTDCAWLAPAGIKLEARVTPGDSQKRTELLQEFLWWLFDGFLIPLIKVHRVSLDEHSRDRSDLRTSFSPRQTSTSPRVRRTRRKFCSSAKTTGRCFVGQCLSSCNPPSTKHCLTSVLSRSAQDNPS